MTLQRKVTEERERLVAQGYSVLAVRTTGEVKGRFKAPLDSGWRTAGGVPLFNSAGTNTGVRCGRLRGVDNDIDDPAKASEVEALAEEHFGPAPTRFRCNSPRTLRVYRSDRPRPKRVIQLPFGKIEILGEGQQFVAFGEHVSGVPYEWRGKSLDTIPFDDLPVITEEAEEAFAQACAAYWKMPAPVAPPPRANGEGIDFDYTDPAGVDAALEALPNDYDNRDAWIKIGMAARASGGSFEAFDAWSQKWRGYDPDETRRVWDSFKPHMIHTITAAHLFAEADRRVPGWRKPSARLDLGSYVTDADAQSAEHADADGIRGWDVVAKPEALPIEPRILRPASEIAPRRWLCGRAYLRGCVAALVAPGGSAKSIIAMLEALAMATGRQLLHDRPVRPFTVFYWNLEDPLDEIERRFVAIAQCYEITPEQYQGRLFFASGLDLPLRIAIADKVQGFTLDEESLARLERTVSEMGIDAVIIDPIISAHGVPENDNVAVDAVIKALAAVAARTNSAIALVHHARKSLAGPARELDAGDARGAAAFVDGCRIVRLVQRMTPAEAEKFGIETDQRWRHLRLVDGKTNHAPPAEVSAWIKLESVPLNNPDADNADGDHIGVPIRWEARPADTTFAPALIEEITAAVRAGEYRADPQARRWVGYALGPLFHLDPEIPAQKRLIVSQVRRLVQAGDLQEINRQDKNYEWKNFIVVPEQSSSTRGAGEVLEGAG